MSIYIIASLCSLATGVCKDHTITTSDFQIPLTMTQCLVGAPQVAEFMRSFPQYRLGGWKCQLGDRPKRDAV